jgi:hypothetical protein
MDALEYQWMNFVGKYEIVTMLVLVNHCRYPHKSNLTSALLQVRLPHLT